MSPSPCIGGGARGTLLALQSEMVHTGTTDVGAISLDDVRLVRDMAARKSGSLSRFYDRWSPDVYAIAIAIVHVSQDAEEVVEDVFWQAWNQASRFDVARGQVRQWITNIARSRALDRLKSMKRRREDTLEAAPLANLAHSANTDDGLVADEQATLVARALKSLPEAQRQVVEMTYYGGLTQTEIASCTGEAIGTVKTRIRLAMQKLRESMVTSGQALS